MANRERRKIRKNLKEKGFVMTEGGDHEVYTFEYQGLRTDASTIISRGSGYKDYGSKLLSNMSHHLFLTKNQLLSLIDCPMEQPDYERILITKGVISHTPEGLSQ